ncbi:hypothetical protein QGM71_10685 [Virgibacillus sp. C22-A2]|uniref:Uncharacterized protein n=1 Tax=Virgibacillus tibetensis TaxID=3042313 RepID=A0ABU6KFU2_9BACI|nr:hypothetical protein [Virgibacillus sp. C22-A2]
MENTLTTSELTNLWNTYLGNTRLMSEVAIYGKDTLNLMIKHRFLDHFPLAKGN